MYLMCCKNTIKKVSNLIIYEAPIILLSQIPTSIKDKKEETCLFHKFHSKYFKIVFYFNKKKYLLIYLQMIDENLIYVIKIEIILALRWQIFNNIPLCYNSIDLISFLNPQPWFFVSWIILLLLISVRNPVPVFSYFACFQDS